MIKTNRGPGMLKFTHEFLKVFRAILVFTFPTWGFTLTTILVLSLLFSFVENISPGNAVYFACITAMTIGYGDITPSTGIGKFISVIIGISGIFTTGIIVAIALQAIKIAYERLISR